MSKYYCFTLNNYDDADMLHLRSLVGQHDITYLCFEPEVGESGTRHLQGYLELSARRRLNPIRKLLGGRVHLERRRGSAVQARDYCKKESLTNSTVIFEEYGVISSPQQGSRNDLEELRTALAEKRPLVEIADNHFNQFLKYQRSINAYRLLKSVPRDHKSRVIVYWGRTGLGKTSRAYAESNRSAWFYPGGGWFDGYEQHEFVIFDDFSGAEFKLPYLLKLLDRYPMRVPIKGGFTEWNPSTIFITSNLDPRRWYSNAHTEHIEALLRRLDAIEHFDTLIQ